MNSGRVAPSASDNSLANELRNLFVVLHGHHNVPRHDSLFLFLDGVLAGELDNLGGAVLKNGGQVDAGFFGDLALGRLFQVSSHSQGWKLEAGLHVLPGLLRLFGGFFEVGASLGGRHGFDSLLVGQAEGGDSCVSGHF